MICFEETGTNFGVLVLTKLQAKIYYEKITESIDKEIFKTRRSSIHLPRGKEIW
jgi:hypothetical protein